MIEQLLDPAYYAYSLFSVPTFLLAVAFLFLGTFVWVRERGTRVSFSFFIMALAAGIWLFAFSGMYSATDKKVALLWAKGAYLGVPFIPAAVYFFAVTVLRITERRNIIVWIVSFLSLVFSFFALATDLLISDLHYYPWGYYPKYGVLGLPFLAFFFGTMALSLYEFSAEFKKAGPGTHKLRVKSFMVGFGVASLGSIDYFAKYGVPIYPFGYLPIFVFFIIAVQTIRRYRLVDITPAFVADQIIATMADSLIVCDAEGKIRLVNPTACSILGYSRTELLGKPMASFLAAARAHRFEEALQGTTIRDEEAELHAKGGRRVDVSISVSHLRDRDQSAQGVVIIGRDIRERKRIEEELNFLAKFPAENPNPVLRISKEGMILYANRVAHALLKLWDWKSGEPSPPFFRTEVSKIYRAGVNRELEVTVGSAIWSLMFNPVSEAGYVNVYGTEITERKRAEERLKHMVHYDALTNLPNRLLLTDRLNQALSRSRRHHQFVVVLFLDLDRFKVINDTLGHHYGDFLLKGVADRLVACVRSVDTVSRLGGDEFVVILDDISDTEMIPRMTQKILDAFSKPFNVHSIELFMTPSIGVSIYPNDGETAEELLKNADAAMYRAKEQGKNNCRFYSSEMHLNVMERLELETSLHHALERNEFVLYYQPVIDLRQGRVVGMEALVRWEKPHSGMISPGKFIPMTEETGLIIPIAEWVLRTACAQNRSWQEAGLPPVKIAVNLSGRQFQQKDLLETITRTLEETGLSPDFLELELTESILMQKGDATIATLRGLNAMGVRISIDDFGTGYSSLSYLKRFPIDKLKIDQSFVSSVMAHYNDAVIAKTVVTMAHGLGLKAIAEGVETAEQLAFLHSVGCDEAQGYFFSRPLPAEEAMKLLTEKFHC